MRAPILILVLAACASPADEPAEPDAFVDEVVVAKLQLRDVVLVIMSGDDGPRYGLIGRDGTLIARDLDATALAALHPEAAEALDSGTARGIFIDASVDRALIDR
jgi:hypothetical protein